MSLYRGVPGRTDNRNNNNNDDTTPAVNRPPGGAVNQFSTIMRPLEAPILTVTEVENEDDVSEDLLSLGGGGGGSSSVLGLSDRGSNLNFSALTETVAAPPPPASSPVVVPITKRQPKPSHQATTTTTTPSRPGGLVTIESGRSLKSNSSHGNVVLQRAGGRGGGIASGSIQHHHSSATPPSLQTTPSLAAQRRHGGRFRGSIRAEVNNKQQKRPAGLLSTKLAMRSTALRRGGKKNLQAPGGAQAQANKLSTDQFTFVPLPTPSTAAVIRRYKVGDYVLVANQHSRWAHQVNKYGFPPGDGESPQERQGPYIYVLATVKKVHFEEIQTYYTVTRADSGADQRADVEYMEPIRSSRGELAALRAATTSQDSTAGLLQDLHAEHALYESSNNKCYDCLQMTIFILLLPFLWLYDGICWLTVKWLGPICRWLLRLSKRQAKLFLNGMDPYVCRVRVTCVNFVVLCSAWYMFIDQLRLAFVHHQVPARVDEALAIVSCAVWVVLVVELFFECFIRPDGYQDLIISEKAFSPMTVRFINGFHMAVETISLGVFVPEFYCLVARRCDARLSFSFFNASLSGVLGPTTLHVFYGRAYYALIRLRVFGLVRHWRNMWIANTAIQVKKKKKKKLKRNGVSSAANGFLSAIVPQYRNSSSSSMRMSIHDKHTNNMMMDPSDVAFTNASTIGTALMATNSYRALFVMWLIVGVFPAVFCADPMRLNNAEYMLTRQLQGTNLVTAVASNENCRFLAETVVSLLSATGSQISTDPTLMELYITPQRCSFQGPNGESLDWLCAQGFWNNSEAVDSFVAAYFDSYCSTRAQAQNGTYIRAGALLTYQVQDNATLPEYSVTARYNVGRTVALAAFSAFLLQICLLVGILGGLSVLRRDAEILVLGPLRRMLKNVARYAKNPLAQPIEPRDRTTQQTRGGGGGRAAANNHDSDNSSYSSSEDENEEYDDDDDLGLGSYETEQLITAVTKITDLLRKCWGVAGADIISTNLATREGALTEVFNPTVPGKSVYALFGFAAINGFDHALRSLGGDVMILINDVAAVLHSEVYRWGFGESGQCNKNLGSAFLMVFRIGFVKDVIQKLEEATDVIFSTGNSKSASYQAGSGVTKRGHKRTGSSNTQEHGGAETRSISSIRSNRRRKERSASVKAMSLSLQSLPGISTFTDRAVLGMLKSFAGIHRDKKIRNWNNDIRLGFGVGAFTVSMIFGMDAGWAVEGAVGSEYKIDATYLSPHVNMASRMMGACKQYGVSIMLSQAVEELMSDMARDKLRHLDTVTVKGSSVKQKIFTYDARPKGVDFFLYSRSDEQADVDSARYSPNIWNTDQDLRAMRQHVSDDFLSEFEAGRKAYISGEWTTAVKRLNRANEIMVENAFEDGYLEDEFEALQLDAQISHEDALEAEEDLKRENGDGPSLCLVAFMQTYKDAKAPPNWDGWHPLTRK